MGFDVDSVEQIVFLEWNMFQLVNEGTGARADCQDDYETFAGMRRGQYAAWSETAREAYLTDLIVAAQAGRNLIAEKYIHMMRPTSPARYAELAKDIVLPNARAQALAGEICAKLLEQTVKLREAYPYVSGSGRPLRTSEDYSGVTSIETYQLGELYTYSEATLTALREHIAALEAQGVSLAEEILLNSVKFYGYKTLEEAEAATKAHAEAQKIEFSFGCDACGE
jgi:hypothetical protein